MARQLKDYKRKEIRCLIVEDFETGRVFKVNKEEEFENIIVKYTKDEITKVYNPTAKQKAEIYEMMDIKNEADKLIGTIEGVDDSTANILFSVITEGGEELLIPATDDFVEEIDDEKREITMNLPDGLLEM